MPAVNRIRIALLINQVDGDYQSPIWHAVDDVCAMRDCDLLIFAGKAPYSPLEEEVQYNAIYKLARSELFDGMIITSGTLANYIGDKAFGEFCKVFSGIPAVSISLPMEGMATVSIDNYGGMKDAVSHLVDHHNAKKIAFIRGPATNREAEERYRAYVDVMTRSALGVDMDLVRDGDFREFTARDAVRYWFDETKIRPEAIVAANDEMAIAAYDELCRRGLKVPDDVSIVGFDDLEAVRSFNPPFTTVNQPLYEQGETAANMLIDCLSSQRDANRAALLAGKSVRLSARLVIRESCGCSSFAPDGSLAAGGAGTPILDMDHSAAFSRDVESLRSALEREIGDESGDDGGKSGKETRGESARYAAGSGGKDSNRDLGSLQRELKSILLRWDKRNVPLTRWQKVLYELKDRYSGERRIRADAAIMRALVLIGELLSSGSGEERLRMSRVLNSLRLIDVSLHKAFSVPRFTEALAGMLFVSGIGEAYLSLYHSPVKDLEGTEWKLPRQSRLVMAYDQSGVLLSGSNWQSFPTADLLPEMYLRGARRKTLVFLPLFIHDRHFGYLGLGSGGSDDLVYETLRERISAAFHSVQLFRREKKAEEKLQTTLDILQKSEERYREMAVLLPSVIIETDRNLEISFINQAGREAFSLSDFDLSRGVSLPDFAYPEDAQKMAEYRERSLKGEGVSSNEFRLVKRDDSRTILLGRVQPIVQDSRVTGFRWGVMDLKPYIEQAMTADDELFRKYRFSARENEVLSFILRGAKIKDISDRLFISESTVKGHITSIYSKIGIKNREELFELIKDHQVNRNGYESFIYSMLIKLFQN
jgi:PAS domain S-box-containing protein